MSCKSNIYAVNTASTAVTANSTIPLTTIVRRYGCDINLLGNAVTLNTPGYYLVNVTATFTAPVAGNVAVTLQNDGVVVPGATAASTITTATTQSSEISINAIVRVFCGSTPDALTLVNTGVAATFSNVAISVVKL